MPCCRTKRCNHACMRKHKQTHKPTLCMMLVRPLSCSSGGSSSFTIDFTTGLNGLAPNSTSYIVSSSSSLQRSKTSHSSLSTSSMLIGSVNISSDDLLLLLLQLLLELLLLRYEEWALHAVLRVLLLLVVVAQMAVACALLQQLLPQAVGCNALLYSACRRAATCFCLEQ